MLIFDNDFTRLREIYNNVLVFFEVLNSDGIAICWAFLKLFSTGFANVEDKFQLQIFKHQKINRNSIFPKLMRQRNQNELTIFDQWRMERKALPLAILNVSVKIFNQKPKTENPTESFEAKEHENLLETVKQKWQKLPGQACKVPNNVLLKIPLAVKGSMNVKFSSDGNLIAYTEVTRERTILRIKKFPELQEAFTFLEHSDLIHDIDWLRRKTTAIESHQWMVTASSDFTAIVWKLDDSAHSYFILPHPTFVFAAKFLSNEDSTKLQVVTAGRDCIIRIWQNRKKSEGFELLQELKHPDTTKTSYITQIATRNAEAFYTASSYGDVIEWTLQRSKEYQLNRHFKLEGIHGNIVTCMDLHPRGSKLFLRVQDFNDSETSATIFVIGVSTGCVTQRHQQLSVEHESAGKLRLTSCGTRLFATNGSVVRFYSLVNGTLVSSPDDFLSFKIPASEKISAIDYHPRDFYLACAVYGRNGGIILCNYQTDTDEANLFEKLKVETSLMQAAQAIKLAGSHFTDLIRKLDEVFLTPIESDGSRALEMISNHDENTFTIDSKRSRTYTVSQGPATYTIQRSQNNTYEVQRKDQSDDDETTISESLN